MAIMTKLEQKLLNHAKSIIPKALRVVKKIQTKKGFIALPFIFDGVIDSLIYDTVLKKFTKIEYYYGIGRAVKGFGSGESSAYFDKMERREFDISNIKTL